MESTADRRRVPPYVSYRAFRACVGRLRATALPDRVRGEALGPRLSPSVRTQAMTALRFLGLVDELDGPTDRLRAILATYQTPEWRSSLAALLTEAYAAVLDTVPPPASSAEFAAAVATQYRTKTDVARKCTAFFMHAARDAGLALVDAAAPRRARQAKPPRPGATAGAGSTGPRNGHTPSYEALLELLDPARMDEREQTAVWTLIRYLKKHAPRAPQTAPRGARR